MDSFEDHLCIGSFCYTYYLFSHFIRFNPFTLYRSRYTLARCKSTMIMLSDIYAIVTKYNPILMELAYT
jgi:hypothetical protein